MMNYTSNDYKQKYMIIKGNPRAINFTHIPVRPVTSTNASKMQFPYSDYKNNLNTTNNVKINNRYERPSDHYYENQSKANISFKTLADSKNTEFQSLKFINTSRTQWGKEAPKTNKEKDHKMSDSIIEELQENKLSTTRYQMRTPMYRTSVSPSPSHTSKPYLKIKQSISHNPSPVCIKRETIKKDILKKSRLPTYQQLVEENKKLNELIKNEYEPIKQYYQRLVKEQEDRDFLIAQLEWKVKQLAKEIKTKNKN